MKISKFDELLKSTRQMQAIRSGQKKSARKSVAKKLKPRGPKAAMMGGDGGSDPPDDPPP